MTSDSNDKTRADPQAAEKQTEDQTAKVLRERLDKKWNKDAQREYLKLVFGA